jgi:adenosylcobinamide kinase/adenosylcobinamide-phosphate guanylyltransferase
MAIAESTDAGQPVRYLATGATPDDDADWSARIAAHRARRPSHWATVESVDVPTQLRSEPATPTLVDDIGGWLTAVMHRRGAWTTGPVTADVDDLIDAVGRFPSPLALVSPEVGLTVVPQTTSGRRFADELGSLNQRLAGLCDRVVLVVAGQPLTVKEPSRAESGR